MSRKTIFQIKKVNFDDHIQKRISGDPFVRDYWPLVYIISDDEIKEAYIGETTDAISRMSAHLKHNKKSKLTEVRLITSEKFNKSATLDIESNLIKYISGDGKYSLINANFGLVDHEYYQKEEIYSGLFKDIWNGLKDENLVQHSLEYIDNTDLFKYSPYKSLSADQKNSLMDMLRALAEQKTNTLVVEGGAGTGKTILAIFIFKLLKSEINDINFRRLGAEEEELKELVNRIRNQYRSSPSMALVIPMSSFRKTIKKVFKNIKGLSQDMVIGPAELAHAKYDMVFVDESHRLRRRVNLGAYYRSFDEANKKLGFDKETGNELDWVIKQGAKRIFFYDSQQTIKPSDIEKSSFDQVFTSQSATRQKLVSQFRSRGGNDYVAYIDRLLGCNWRQDCELFESSQFEFLLFEEIDDLVRNIKQKNGETGLSRIVAGYSWKWVSKKSPDAHDIEIDGVRLKWNSCNEDWINSEGAINEVGCIHTTQGYDLNYVGVIFGNEISYDQASNKIIILDKNYHDKNGKNTITDIEELKEYIINIYKTLMLRGILGAYIYVCDQNLREYFSRHIKKFHSSKSNYYPFTLIASLPKQSSKNLIPVYDLKVAAGGFGDDATPSVMGWTYLSDYDYGNGYFIAQVIGESMNKRIPSGSWCLFKANPGGSREGKIVLVQHRDIQDVEMGGHYTVKEYHSEKAEADDGSWKHSRILLRPKTSALGYKDIVLEAGKIDELQVVGEFISIVM